jgi:hypothetical protein
VGQKWCVPEPEPDPFPFPEEIPLERVIKQKAGSRNGGSILMAAMLGLADAMGFDREPVEIVEVIENDQPDFDLQFGDLRPLDWRQDG